MNRTQISLTFNDEEVYDELIVPLKTNKELTPLVIRLLTLYYYDDNFRGMVLTEEQQGYEELAKKYEDYFKDIQINLMQMEAVEQEMGYTLKSGIDHLSSVAENRDDIDEDMWGKTVPKYSKALEQNISSLPNSVGSEGENLPATLNVQEQLMMFENKFENIIEEKMSTVVSGLQNQMEEMLKVMQTTIQAVTQTTVQPTYSNVVPLQEVPRQQEVSAVNIQQSIPTQQPTYVQQVVPTPVQNIQPKVDIERLTHIKEAQQEHILHPSNPSTQEIHMGYEEPEEDVDIMPMSIRVASPVEQVAEVPSTAKFNKLLNSLK